MIDEVRYAARGLARSPWYSATVVGIMALAFSLSTTAFALFDGVLFKPLPYGSPDRLVSISLAFSVPSQATGSVYSDLIDQWESSLGVPITAVRVGPLSGLERPNEPGLGLAMIRPNLFDVLETRPLIGGFAADAEPAQSPGPAPIPIVISYRLWQERFQRDFRILGQLLAPTESRSASFQVVGVLPPGFVLPADRSAEVLIAGRYSGPIDTTSLVARLPEGLPLQEFRAQFERALRESTVRNYRGAAPPPKPDRAIVRPLSETLGRSYSALARALVVGGLLVVLIACTNVSGLMAARCLERTRDIGLRRSIGARNQDIVRLVLTEQGLLLAAAVLISLGIVFPLLRVAVALLPPDVNLLKTPTFDARVLGFDVGLMIASLGLSSLWPIRRALQAPPVTLTSSGGSSTAAVRRRRFGVRAIIASQIAATMVLVTAGGLVINSLRRVQSNETGYRVEGTVIAAILIDGTEVEQEGSAQAAQARLQDFLGEVRRLPDVASAGAAGISGMLSRSLMYELYFRPAAFVPKVAAGPKFDPHSGVGIPVTEGFFDAAGLSVFAGRLPSDRELASGVQVAVVSRSFASQYYPDGNALGGRLRQLGRNQGTYVDVIGVVEDPRLFTWDRPATSAAFVPYKLFGRSTEPTVFVRSERSARTVASHVLATARLKEPEIRPIRVQPVATILRDTIRSRRAQAMLFGASAASGLALAGVGLLGLSAMSMASRTREIGIRSALGATPGRIVVGSVLEQCVPVCMGLAIGIGASLWAVQSLQAQLYELSIYDVTTWIVAIAVILVTTLLGTVIPLLRTSRMDPTSALRAV